MAIYQSIAGMASLIGILLPLGTITTVLRFVARYKQKNAYGIDDFLLLPALTCFIGLSALAIYGMINKFVAVPVPKDPTAVMNILPQFIKVFWVADMLSVFTIGFIRLSALFFYRRLFTAANKWDSFGIITFISILILVLWMVGFFLLQVFGCGSHFEWLFDPKLSTNCVIYPYLNGVAISSFILDFLVLIIPIPKIWTLHTNTTRKLAISMVFLLAAAGAAASCTRMVLATGVLRQGRVKNDQDPFLSNTTLLYFMLLEAGLCLVAVSLPSIWYFISGMAPERILRSIRSIVPLRSERSTGSKRFYASDKGNIHTDEYQFDNMPEPPLATKRDEYETTVEERFNSK